VKHIAMVHGGDIRVDSALGRGSVFTLRLPHAGADTSQ
jgi:signal transduction histidine kinase